VGALEIARRIDDAWFRSQALAYAALHWPDPAQRIKIIDESSADLRFVNTAALTVRNRIEEVAEKPETLSDFSATFF
jgi:hypothetical protein